MASRRGERKAAADFFGADHTERSGRGCGETWKRFTRLYPARRVVSCERRADHELDLMEHHQWYDDEPNVPGEQQRCYWQAAGEAFL